MYRSATFYVYSGTGNSLRVAMWMADVARRTGVPTVVSARTVLSRAQGNGTALIGVVLPTHAFMAPVGALRLVRSLSAAGGHMDALVVATRGATRVAGMIVPGFEGAGALLCSWILRAKGYRIRAAAGVDMPSNWTALHPALPADAIAEIRARGRAQAEALVSLVLSGQRRALPVLTLFIGLVLLPLSFGYTLLGRRLLGKLFFASGRCTGCGRCAAHCPCAAIVMHGPPGARFPLWTLKCESCMRCMAFCPVAAVQVSYAYAIGTAVVALGLPATKWVAALAVNVPSLDRLADAPGWIATLLLWTFLILLGLPVRDSLLRWTWFRRLAGRVTVTRWYGRYHEPETPVTDLLQTEALPTSIV